jgi:hypothetical protein
MNRPAWMQRVDDALSVLESALIGGVTLLAFVIGAGQVMLR